MLRGTFTKRLALVAAVTATGVAGSAQPAHAGPLCDWLFGRHQAPVAPYVAGYPYAAAYAYPVAAPYAANYPYTANYPVAPAPTGYASAYPATTLPVQTAPSSGAYALQMPSYSAAYGNAAGYGAYPVTPAPSIPATVPGDQGYAMFSPPAGSRFPVDPAPVTSYYGTGNVYPTYGAGTSYQSGYGTVAPVTAFQAPVVTNPSTVQTYPGVPAASPGVFGGMSRFFSNLFGTGYQSSYNQVPVTYYRPVTSYSPAVGAPTVVQQPCTSYEYQLQRSPMTTFAPGTSTPTTIAPATSCAPTTNYYNPYVGNNAYTGNDPYVGSGVAPAAAYDNVPANSYPQTTQPGQYYGPPTTSSPAPGSYNGGGNPDSIEIGQPQLESSARPSTSPYLSTPTTPPPTSWWTQSAMRSGMTDSEALEKKRQFSAPALQEETTTSARTDLRPLPADAYPYQRQLDRSTPAPLPQAAPTTRPSQPRQIEDNSQDRVAALQSWGYKPIQWTVSRASYESDSLEVQKGDISRAQAISPSLPTDSESRYAPPLNQSKITRPIAEPSVTHTSTPNSSTTLRSGTGSVQPSQPRSYSEYDSSGWTAKPRR